MTNESDTIETKLFSYLSTECLPTKEAVGVGVNDNLFDRGIVDSAGLISFIGYMEKEFGLVIPDEDLLPQNFATIASIARYIRTQQQNDRAAC